MLKTNTAITFLALFSCSATAHAVVTFDWATVGNAGNTADNTGYGAVSYSYRISKHEVTNTQYTAFLNAVDPMGTNPNSVYSNSMGSSQCTRRYRLQRGGRQRLEIFHEDEHGQQARELRFVL